MVRVDDWSLTQKSIGRPPGKILCERSNAGPKFARNTRFWSEGDRGQQLGRRYPMRMVEPNSSPNFQHLVSRFASENIGPKAKLFGFLTTINCCTVSCEHRFAFNSQSAGVHGDRTCVNSHTGFEL